VANRRTGGRRRWRAPDPAPPSHRRSCPAGRSGGGQRASGWPGERRRCRGGGFEAPAAATMPPAGSGMPSLPVTSWLPVTSSLAIAPASPRRAATGMAKCRPLRGGRRGDDAGRGRRIARLQVLPGAPRRAPCPAAATGAPGMDHGSIPVGCRGSGRGPRRRHRHVGPPRHALGASRREEAERLPACCRPSARQPCRRHGTRSPPGRDHRPARAGPALGRGRQRTGPRSLAAFPGRAHHRTPAAAHPRATPSATLSSAPAIAL